MKTKKASVNRTLFKKHDNLLRLVGEFLEGIAEKLLSDGRRIEKSLKLRSRQMPAAQEDQEGGYGEPEKHANDNVSFRDWTGEFLH